MQLYIMLKRASLAGFVWAVVFGIPFTLRGFMNGETRQDSFLSGLFLLGWTVLLLSVLGMVLALPYTALLTFWETRVRPDHRCFLVGSIISCGALVAVPAFYYGLSAHDPLPVIGFTGSMRIATAHFVAALAAGYAVGRYLPQTGDNPAARAYEEYRGWLWAEYIFGILILLSFILFPTFGGPAFPIARA